MGTPQLNIKDAEATRLARELAELTGELQTKAVRRALAERLDREKAERDAKTARTAEESRREFERVWPKILENPGKRAPQGLVQDRAHGRRSLRRAWTAQVNGEVVVIDLSVIVAIYKGEEDGSRLAERITSYKRKLMSAATWLELAMVCESASPGWKKPILQR